MVVTKLIAYFNERGESVDNLSEAVLIIESECDAKGNIIKEKILKKEGFTGEVIPKLDIAG